MTADERAARAALSATVEPGTVPVARRIRRDGVEATWHAVVTGRAGLDATETTEEPAAQVDGAAIVAAAEADGIRFICPGDAEWPNALDSMVATLDVGLEPVPPPFGLWVRGAADLSMACARAVAVVGSRASTRYGQRVASDLGADLALAGWTVVSGAAFGIDAAAHRGALALGGATLAVMACGVDVAYPRAHAELLDRILAQGAVISELPPGLRPMRSRFLARNRVIAALTAGTVVVEAAARSGALSTAAWAVKLGREVLAVPGPVTSALSVGCHQLVRRGAAILVTDAREVVDAVGELGLDAVDPPRGRDRPLDRVDPFTRRLFELLPAHEAVSADQLIGKAGLAAAAVHTALAELAAAGLVSEGLDGWRIRRGGA